VVVVGVGVGVGVTIILRLGSLPFQGKRCATTDTLRVLKASASASGTNFKENDMDELLTTKEVAEMLGIKPQTLRKYVMQGKEPQPTYAGRGNRGVPNEFWRSDVERVLTQRKDHATVRKS